MVIRACNLYYQEVARLVFEGTKDHSQASVDRGANTVDPSDLAHLAGSARKLQHEYESYYGLSPRELVMSSKLDRLRESLGPLDLFEAMPRLVFVKDRAGRFKYGNPAMLRFYGLTSIDDLVEKTDNDFFPNDPYVDLFVEDDQIVIDTKQVKTIRREQVHGYCDITDPSRPKGRSLHWLSTIKMPHEFEGETFVVGISTFINDVVEQENEQVKLRGNQVWERVSRHVTHRIGNKISTIESIADPLPETAEDRKLALDAVKSIKMLLQELRQLREAGVLNKKTCSINEIVDQALAETPLPNHAEIAIHDHISRTESTKRWRIQADARKLVDCFQEMIMNAMAWAPTSGARINIEIQTQYTVTSAFYPNKGRFVVARISDNGPGIEDENKNDIFYTDFTTRPDGTGIGLAVVKEIIEAHGGTVTEDGKFGEGACFVVSLPV